MNKDIQLYIGYMNDEQKNRFNLKDNDNVHLLNLSHHSNGQDINDINCHYSELCVMYYVWKHQLKSDYVSIGQHRRYITPINFKRLDNNEIQVFPTLAREDYLTPYEFMLKDGFDDYIIISFIKYLLKNNLASKEKIYDVIFNQKFNISYFNVFACNWDVFNNISRFVFGFMQSLMLTGTFTSLKDINTWNSDMSLFLDKERFIINENNLFNDYEWGRINTKDRNVAAIFELLIPIYGKICYDVFYEENNKKIGVEINDINGNIIYDNILKWISKNTFSGTLNYYIKTTNKNIDFLQKLIDENWYNLSSGNIQIVEEFPEDTIVLKLNEYIDVDNPLDELNIDNIKTY